MRRLSSRARFLIFIKYCKSLGGDTEEMPASTCQTRRTTGPDTPTRTGQKGSRTPRRVTMISSKPPQSWGPPRPRRPPEARHATPATPTCQARSLPRAPGSTPSMSGRHPTIIRERLPILSETLTEPNQTDQRVKTKRQKKQKLHEDLLSLSLF
jgi:hypothetical protein